MVAIRTERATKIFNKSRPNETIALREVSIEAKKGKVTVFKGPSGSGKTTLLSLIGCVSRPTSGRVFVAGKEVSKLPEHFLTIYRRAHIGLIFQQFNLIMDLTVLENTILPLYPLGIPLKEMKERGQRVLEKLGLQKRINYRIKETSAGEQQRVAMARALINNPEIVIADEPTAHLDTTLSRDFLEIVGETKKEGHTVIIATHDPLVYEEAFVDMVYEMRDGEITGVKR